MTNDFHCCAMTNSASLDQTRYRVQTGQSFCLGLRINKELRKVERCSIEDADTFGDPQSAEALLRLADRANLGPCQIVAMLSANDAAALRKANHGTLPEHFQVVPLLRSP
jgi:hypothetical protein